MRKVFFFFFSILIVLFFLKTASSSTCAYNIDTCGGIGSDGQSHNNTDTICYYSITEHPFFTSDADHACKRAGCPDLPGGKTCDDLIRNDPNRSGTEHAIYVNTSVPNGSPCLSVASGGAPSLCCAKVTALPTIIVGTATNPCPDGKCQTSFGQIDVQHPQAVISKIFSILLSVSGIVALILIITSGYQLSLSQGNPEKVKNARERLTAAIIGLIFIIFSVAILQIVGVDILQLPGFKK